ncbi:MAG: hypothetical protein IM584_09350 [Chitinophagaceae bacterium]|nr:hypothetical protein [Chitinophagaceae bacterium]MCA6454417.1 hypothetical protein [Chitinophagaceae bacterium]MCA6456324.1 hypothetical protein [Chitinophagaceae bacterium]MCA6459686.1 hypothetical protein [Chitinophagaceae bacterium]MCA6464553.1 hypothetical protein [Chitinophagaceae bacterium]
MAAPFHNHRSTLFITLGGSFAGFCKAIAAEDIVRTCLLAACGTLVSFLLTLVLKKWFKKQI